MRVRDYEMWDDNMERSHKIKKGKILKKLRDTEKKETVPIKQQKRTPK